MKKFERFNKHLNVKETFVACDGTLETISESPLRNKVSDKPYYRFTATVNTPKGTTLVGGQVYEALVPYLGSMPKPGDRLQFASRLEDLKEGFNTRWGIGGNSVDAVSDELLDFIGDL